MAIDIKLNSDAGYFDFSITSGDFTTTSGLDSALLMSMFVNKRADFSEVAAVGKQQGWWGNTIGGYANYEIGSKLWLLYQAKHTNNTLNLAKTYTYDGLSWFLADQLADRIVVADSFTNNNLLINVDIYKSQNKISSTAYTLWANTQGGRY
jgi:phage gp46-like protein